MPRDYSGRASPPTASPLRRLHHAKGVRDAVVLHPDHPAAVNGTTMFTKTINAGSGRLLKSGHNSRKIGKRVTKGKWKGFPIFTLTLEERATCPRTCEHWLDCYGNHMPFAERHRHGPDFEEALWNELAVLDRRHPKGFVVRLHVLGDFYSLGYVGLWRQALAKFPGLHVFGYTARSLDDRIGKALYELASVNFDRFALRFSGQDWKQLAAPTVEQGEVHPAAITCPAQTGATECCATCGLCWATQRSVAFERHGRSVRAMNEEGALMSWTKIDNPKPNLSAAPVDGVRVSARAALGKSRYIVIRIGRFAADRMKFLAAEHRVHVMLGQRDDDGKVGITLDDSHGKFTAKRKADGSYQLTIREVAAQGRFSLEFPPFSRPAAIVPLPGQPPVMTFEASPEFLAVRPVRQVA